MILLPAVLLMSGCAHPVLGNKVYAPERPEAIGKQCCNSKGLEYNVYAQKDIALYGAQLETALAQCMVNFKGY
jgi:hypothetical protein